MVYVPEDPEEGESRVIPLVERCPKLRATFEAIRHGLPPPDFTTDCESNREQSQSIRSKSTTTDAAPKRSNKQPCLPFQETVTPPTDAECGLPSALSVALSEIPTSLLPLSRTLASSQTAAVINGHTRRELQEAFAHATNLRRATGRARAILVITSSEKTVREWVAGMCQALDEVQLISYSRAPTKREATLMRLRQAQYPGIVVAAEKTLRDGVRDLWQALRENRIAKKWEIVISEAVTDKNMEGECSPLRMLRDGVAEKCIIIARKGLTERKACMVASGLRGVDVEKRFWLSKEDIRKISMEEGRREIKTDQNKLADANAIKSKGRKSRPSPEGKENRLLPQNAPVTKAKSAQEGPVIVGGKRKASDTVKRTRSSKDPEVHRVVKAAPSSSGNWVTSGDPVKSRKKKWSSLDEDAGGKSPLATTKTAQQGPVKAKGKRRTSDGVRKERSSKEPGLEVYRVVKAVPPSIGNSIISGGVVKPRKRKGTSPRGKMMKDSTDSGSRRISDGAEKVYSRKESTKISRKSPQVRTKGPVVNRRLSDNVRKALLRIEVEKIVSKSHNSSEVLLQPPASRRRSPRLSPSLSSDEKSTVSAASRPQSRKQQSSELRKGQEPVANRSKVGRKSGTRSLGSSSQSGVKNKAGIGSSQEEDETWSLKTREKFESRARTLHLYSSESSDTSEEKYYTPPSHAPAPQSEDTTPEKFVSPRTSFSPRKPIRATTEPVPKSHKTPPDQIAPPSLSSSAQHKSKTVKHAIPKPHKPAPETFFSPRASCSPYKRDHMRKKDKSLNLADDTSDDEPLVRKMSDLRKQQERRTFKAALTPPPVKRNITSHRASFPTSSAGKSRGSKRPSVFEGLLSPGFGSKNSDAGIRRTKSFPAPVQVKREASPPPQGFSWTWGNPKYKASRATSRRKSLPSSSPGASVLPVKRKLPIHEGTSPANLRETSPPRSDFTWTWGNPKYKTSRATSGKRSLPSSSPSASVLPVKRKSPIHERTSPVNLAGAVAPRRGPRVMRVSSKDRLGSTTPTTQRRNAPVDTTPPNLNPAEPEVIVISSESEVTPRPEAISKKRRIFDNDEARARSRDRPRNITTSGGKSTSPVSPRPRDRMAAGSGSRNRSMHSNGASRPNDAIASGSGSQNKSADTNGAAGIPLDSLASFVRGVKRARSVQHLSRSQRKLYNKNLAEGKRFENLGMRTEAFDSYQRCFDIYDGDQNLLSRYLALASTEGHIHSGDFPRKPTKSPIKRRSRRRRHSGNRRQVDRSRSSVEVIDLTSA